MTTLDPRLSAPLGPSDRFALDQHLPADFADRALRTDVLAGLSATPKTLPPKWFYDARGSELFTAITRLPEYYPTRAEAEILAREAGEIATATAADTVVELGSGSSEKTHLLLDALRDAGTLARYVAVDVSESALVEAAAVLLGSYSDLVVHSVVADFEQQLHLLPADGERRLFVFLGGTIGNFAPPARRAFLAAVRACMRPGDHLLLGTDLVKSPAVLVPAYDDAAGVTAEFNKNVLRVINRELGADFDLDRFEHVAVWDTEHEWIEMRLRSVGEQLVRIPSLGLDLQFRAGEEMRTEISAKFRRSGVVAELDRGGLELKRWWTDSEGRFGLSLGQRTA